MYTVRTLRGWTGGPDLIWYGAAGNRTKASIAGFGILDGYHGVLVRDDYGGYVSYNDGLAGVQQCLAHLYRYLDDAYAIDPVSQAWTRQGGDALRAAGAAVRVARDARQASLDSGLLARLRHSYDQAVAFGISVNLSRPWHKGNHPGLILAAGAPWRPSSATAASAPTSPPPATTATTPSPPSATPSTATPGCHPQPA